MMAAKAVALAEARQPEFQTYAQAIADNAKSLAEGFLKRGGKLVTGGTDNHIVLLDVTSFGLTGRQAESALLDAGVVTNRNSVPQDPNGAWYTSGVRLGTPALTTRGFGHDEFDKVAELMVEVLSNTQPGETKAGGPSKATYVLADGRRRPRQGRLRRAPRRPPAVPRPRTDVTRRRALVRQPSPHTGPRHRHPHRAPACRRRLGRPAVACVRRGVRVGRLADDRGAARRRLSRRRLHRGHDGRLRRSRGDGDRRRRRAGAGSCPMLRAPMEAQGYGSRASSRRARSTAATC